MKWWHWALIGGAALWIMKKATDKISVPNPSDVVVPNGSQGVGKLTAQQVYNLCRDAGFDPTTARRMVAIAMRESGGNTQLMDPTAVCNNCYKNVKEYSLGLFQLNMLGDLGAARLKQFGLVTAEQLFDPATAARAAFLTWGGSENNLRIAWAIDKTSPIDYKGLYEKNLASLPSVDQMEALYA